MPVHLLGRTWTDSELWPLTNFVLPAWLALALAPMHKLTQALVLLTALAFCILYALLLVPIVQSRGSSVMNDFTSLEGITRLFSDPSAVFLGWVHYVAGDLWLGRWVALDARRRRIPLLLMLPVIASTLLFAPVGLGGYLLMRGLYTEVKAGRGKME